MVQLTSGQIEELKNKELDLYNRIAVILSKNRLRYVALHGTLLGAIRHKGFIPWDDDIDLGMPRKDYEYMISNFEHIFPEDIGLITPENSKHYEVMFVKIHDRTTTYIELGMSDKPDRYSGVFIDIFPIDGAPSELDEQKKFKRKYELYMKLNYKMRFDIKDVHTKRAKLLHALFVPIKTIIPYDYYYKKHLKLVHSFDFDESEFWTFPTTVYKFNYIFRKRVFDNIIPWDFENTKIPVPIGYDEFLSQAFGDYMTFPPEDKRIPHHFADYISFDKPYIEYNLSLTSQSGKDEND